MHSSGRDEGGWVQGLCVWGADIEQVRVLVRVGGVERSSHHSWLCKWMAERFSKHLIEYGLASSISTSPVHAGQAGQATCLLSKNCAAGVG